MSKSKTGHAVGDRVRSADDRDGRVTLGTVVGVDSDCVVSPRVLVAWDMDQDRSPPYRQAYMRPEWIVPADSPRDG